jgi:hypothetical protein
VAGSEDQAERLIADLVVQPGLDASTAAWLPYFQIPAEFGVLRLAQPSNDPALGGGGTGAPGQGRYAAGSTIRGGEKLGREGLQTGPGSKIHAQE